MVHLVLPTVVSTPPSSMLFTLNDQDISEANCLVLISFRKQKKYLPNSALASIGQNQAIILFISLRKFALEIS